jgi:hypothetical protein
VSALGGLRKGDTIVVVIYKGVAFPGRRWRLHEAGQIEWRCVVVVFCHIGKSLRKKNFWVVLGTLLPRNIDIVPRRGKRVVFLVTLEEVT